MPMQVFEVPVKAHAPRRANKDLPAMDSQFGVASASKRVSSHQEVANDSLKALAGNGYLRGRGIRMRLLHKHVCTISGPALASLSLCLP